MADPRKAPRRKKPTWEKASVVMGPRGEWLVVSRLKNLHGKGIGSIGANEVKSRHRNSADAFAAARRINEARKS